VPKYTKVQFTVSKSSLSLDDVRAIAELARLELTDDEVRLYAEQLSAILGDFQTLQEVETSHIAPTASVLPLKSVMRADIPLSPLNPEQVIANAADAEDNQIKVRAVLGDE
jgi:aspartyl-tRNA(Asn)/glutamyl-tRNA(Gln) amidotransferase subunit C